MQKHTIMTRFANRSLPSNTALLMLISALAAACQSSAGPEPVPGADLAAGLALAPTAGTRANPASLTIDRASHDFGLLHVAELSAATVFTVHNGGPRPVNGLTLHLTQGAGFTVTATTCASSLAARSTCTIAVAFAPVQVGPA
ncbi:MAG TPA: choice-of-anchor D domain-containing protein, partial [Haliangium sp.]|nr:choice-of-anchor D domain-containing protein [Haliangium sp.]